MQKGPPRHSFQRSDQLERKSFPAIAGGDVFAGGSDKDFTAVRPPTLVKLGHLPPAAMPYSADRGSRLVNAAAFCTHAMDAKYPGRLLQFRRVYRQILAAGRASAAVPVRNQLFVAAVGIAHWPSF